MGRLEALRPLLLLGAGGLAREVIAAVRAGADSWKPIGLLDDDPRRRGGHIHGLPVLGPVESVADHPEAALVVCVANSTRPAARLDLVRRLGLPPERFATVVHPAADVPDGAQLGPGTVMLAGCVMTTPMRLGAHVLAMPLVLFTHDDEIADGATLAGRATLAGGVHVGECAYIGQGALVREHVRIGARAVVGMGAVVLSHVPAGEVWAGVPARPLRQQTERT